MGSDRAVEKHTAGVSAASWLLLLVDEVNGGAPTGIANGVKKESRGFQSGVPLWGVLGGVGEKAPARSLAARPRRSAGAPAFFR